MVHERIALQTHGRCKLIIACLYPSLWNWRAMMALPLVTSMFLCSIVVLIVSAIQEQYIRYVCQITPFNSSRPQIIVFDVCNLAFGVAITQVMRIKKCLAHDHGRMDERRAEQQADFDFFRIGWLSHNAIARPPNIWAKLPAMAIFGWLSMKAISLAKRSGNARSSASMRMRYVPGPHRYLCSMMFSKTDVGVISSRYVCADHHRLQDVASAIGRTIIYNDEFKICYVCASMLSMASATKRFGIVCRHDDTRFWYFHFIHICSHIFGTRFSLCG